MEDLDKAAVIQAAATIVALYNPLERRHGEKEDLVMCAVDIVIRIHREVERKCG